MVSGSGIHLNAELEPETASPYRMLRTIDSGLEPPEHFSPPKHCIQRHILSFRGHDAGGFRVCCNLAVYPCSRPRTFCKPRMRSPRTRQRSRRLHHGAFQAIRRGGRTECAGDYTPEFTSCQQMCEDKEVDHFTGSPREGTDHMEMTG